jgi:hypothetical protein
MTLGSVIMTVGVTQHPDGFAGAEVLANGQVAVYVVPGHDSAFLVALPPLTDTASGPSYVLKPVSNSWAGMDSLTQRIAADSDALREKGIILAKWGPDVRLNKVVINMRSYDAAQADYLVQRYGEDVVEVSTTSMTNLPRRC